MDKTTTYFSPRILDLLHQTGAHWRDDRDALVAGTHTPDTLLAFCLDGVEDEADAAEWRDYVATLMLLRHDA